MSTPVRQAGGCALRHPQRPPDLLVEELGDDVVAFVPALGRTVVLNAIGAVVLELADGRRTAAEIADDIVAVLPADRERVAREVVAVLDRYAELGLVGEAPDRERR